MNNLVYFGGYSGCSMIVIASWAIENSLVYLRTTYILVGSMVVIVSCAIENNLVYLRPILVGHCDNFLGYLE